MQLMNLHPRSRPANRAYTASGLPMRRCGRPGFALLDVLVAGILMSIALVSILGLASQSLQSQIRGEEMQRAAMLVDELLNEVLMVGPETYAKELRDGEVFSEEYRLYYEIEINLDANEGYPYPVTVRVWSQNARGEPTLDVSVATRIARRLGDEPDPEREPETEVIRDE